MLLVKEDKTPQDITFKPLPGCLEGAAVSSLSFVPDLTYAQYLTSGRAVLDAHFTLPASHTAKGAVEPNQEAQVGASERVADRKEHRNVCTRCEKDSFGDTLEAVREVDVFCHNCGTDFCRPCYERTHDRPPWSSHQCEDIVGPQGRVRLVRVGAAHHSSRPNSSNNDNSSSGGGGERSKKSRKSKKKRLKQASDSAESEYHEDESSNNYNTINSTANNRDA